ncbi:GDYXXLXY domain-containing protein [Chryseolinea lacunae]|uniref:GDYXXLXY domain-containing protein n=1 Tax=Chryseolinea lacunae TaxID=2801331 RepID=A0ABS1KUW2_9BACT|nr:GDYXXLXY domain-containing protein [Chryseolinea lacunae]MBL0743235.1 GDYXXLXY domain-containing protein [Chryseolinea lacunae]
MKKFLLILFVFMCVAQWLVPAKMIYDNEVVVTEGLLYKFRTQPVDPSDPFRGKYVTLSFDANAIVLPDSGDWVAGEEAFVSFGEDSLGFATPASISREEPDAPAFLKTTVNYVENYSDSPYIINFTLPFDRFYLEESKASQAEQAYWQAQRDSAQVAYGVVRIGKGQAVLTDVMINDKSIVELVKELNTTPE